MVPYERKTLEYLANVLNIRDQLTVEHMCLGVRLEFQKMIEKYHNNCKIIYIDCGAVSLQTLDNLLMLKFIPSQTIFIIVNNSSQMTITIRQWIALMGTRKISLKIVYIK